MSLKDDLTDLQLVSAGVSQPSYCQVHSIGQQYSDQNVFHDVYYQQFWSLLQEECGRASAGEHNEARTQCECLYCVPAGTWALSPFPYLTLRLIISDLKLDIVTTHCVQLTNDNVSLFISLDQANNLAPTVAVLFHNSMRLIVRQHRRPRHLASQEIEITTGQYSVSMRSNAVYFNSKANMLTYSLDKSGCKTKVSKPQSFCWDDFVRRHFNAALNRQNNDQARNSARQVNVSSNETSTVWSIDNQLTVVEQSDGTVCLGHPPANWFLTLDHRQSCFSLQLPNVCLLLNKSGHFCIAQQQSCNQRPERTNDGHKLGSIRERIRLVDSEVDNSVCTVAQASGDWAQPPPLSVTNSASATDAKWHLTPRLMDSFEQYAISGTSGLLVRHANRRAALNYRHMICLL